MNYDTTNSRGHHRWGAFTPTRCQRNVRVSNVCGRKMSFLFSVRAIVRKYWCSPRSSFSTPLARGFVAMTTTILFELGKCDTQTKKPGQSHSLRRFGLMWWPAYVGVVRLLSLSIIKWAARISRERFKRGSPYITLLSGAIGLTDMLDVISLATFGQLRDAIKYCTKVRKTTSAS